MTLKVAEHQLDAATRLLLDASDVISAITLAGASEEIFGKLLEKWGGQHSLAEFVETCAGIGKHVYGEERAARDFVEMRTVFRNELKHLMDGEPITVPRAATEEIINRAIDNL